MTTLAALLAWGSPLQMAKAARKKTIKKKAKKKTRSTPYKLNNQMVANLVKAFAAGLTEDQAAEALGISRKTISNWKKGYPAILYAIENAKDVFDGLVEASLGHRAIGYSCEETKLFAHEGVVISRENVIKHYPPDVRAATWWLQNRRPDRWRLPEKEKGDEGSTGPETFDDDPWDLQQIE